MANLTLFGKEFRKFRIDRDLTLKHTAEKLQVTPAYISNVETGRKPLNLNFLNQIIQTFDANREEIMALEIAASQTMKDVSISVPANELQSQLAVMFARRIENNSIDLQKLFESMDKED